MIRGQVRFRLPVLCLRARHNRENPHKAQELQKQGKTILLHAQVLNRSLKQEARMCFLSDSQQGQLSNTEDALQATIL